MKKTLTRQLNLKTQLEKIVSGIVHSTITSTPSSSNPAAGGRVPALIILGEIYGKDLENRVIGNYRVIGGMNPTGDARHRFTVLKHIYNNDDEDIEYFPYNTTDVTNKNENAVCVIMRIKSWLAAFVRPNHICNDPALGRLTGVKSKLHILNRLIITSRDWF